MKPGKYLSVAVLNLSLLSCAMPQTQTPTPSPSPAPPPAPPPTSPQDTASAPGAKTFSQEKLEQLLAPIALHPDALLAQILMASTYPLEIVEAERWVKANPKLKEKALEDALQKQSWDPSVKSLTVFPQVLTMMSEKLDWTRELGDAFLAQQKDVLATTQALRNKAMAQGALKDSREQKLVVEGGGSSTVIKIEPTDPSVVYVPTYNPTVVYGTWPYPAYPPYYYYPPGYAAGGMLFGFAAGAIVGGALWGNCNWDSGNVNVNVNKYNSFNRSNVTNGNWSHNSAHRGAVPYKDKGVAQQYGRGQSANAASREQFRGYAEAGRGSSQRGEGGGGSANRQDTGGRDAAARNAGERGGDRDARERSASTQRSSLDSGRERNNSALDTGRARQTNDFSNRGSSSLSSARSSGNVGGGMRGGGGRGGGGRR